MAELAAERVLIREALDEMEVDGWLYEEEAGARPQSIQETFLEELKSSDLYVGVFWKKYGKYTIEEFEKAQELGKPCLLYEQRSGIEGERDPALQDFLDRLSNVENGLSVKWIKAGEDIGSIIKKDLARILTEDFREDRSGADFELAIKEAVEKIREELFRENTPVDPRDPVEFSNDDDRRDLLQLLEKVDNFWIKGYLNNSIYAEVLLDLGMETKPEAVENPWRMHIEVPNSEAKSIPDGKKIGEVYKDVGKTLLILGAPGSGKTITLLQLATHLIKTARYDPASPVPVVFNLSSWAEAELSFFDWIIEEFKLKYKIPKRFSKQWIENNWLVFLLDGLDEVKGDKRAACVDAINEFATEYGVPGLVVCSRLDEYTNLPNRLSLGGALHVNPLEDKDIKEYISRAGNKLYALEKLLESDTNLHALAKTPLMLNVMSLAYEGLDEKETEDTSAENEKTRISHLFLRYVDRMFARKGDALVKHTKENTIEGLSWLARKMQENGKTIFQIEELQPSWLSSKRGKLAYFIISRLCGGLIVGLSGGLPFGLIGGLLFGLSGGLSDRLSDGLSGGLILGLIFGLTVGLSGGAGGFISIYFENLWLWVKNRTIVLRFTIQILIYGLIGGLIGGLIVGLIFGLFFGLFFGLSGGLLLGLSGGVFWSLRSQTPKLGDIQTVEQLSWSLKKSLRKAVSGLLFGLIYGLIGGLLFGLIVGLGGGLIEGLLYGLIEGLLFGLFFGLSGGLLLGPIFGGITTSIYVDKINPNQGISLSLWNAFRLGLIGGLIVGLIGGLLFGLIVGLGGGLLFGLLFGLIGGLVGFLWFGGMDAIQHYVLRGVLYYSKRIPLRYSDFLDYAAKLIIMRKVGGSYIFIHRMLLEYFAELGEEQKDVQRAQIRNKS